MKIERITIKKFKRFTDLTISDIPETAKLIVLVGVVRQYKSKASDNYFFLNFC
jgi:predicted ATP-dependent endonuclease of OLD family